MRVLVVTHHLAPELLVLWRACAETGVDLHLAGTVDAPNVEAYRPHVEVPDWAPCHLFRPRDVTGRGLLWWWYPGLTRLIRAIRPDVVHVNGEAWAVTVTQVMRADAAVVIHGADNMFGHGAAAEVVVRRAVARRNLRRAAAYVSWNHAGAGLARRHGLPHSAPTLVAPAVIPDPVLFPPSEPPDRPYTVGFLGRLVPLKGADLLVAACREAGVPRCVIAGDGPDRAGLAGPGVELVGAVDHEAVPAFLAGLDVLVVPSITMPSGAEQFGRVVVEAMWAGTPVVVSDSGALPEVVGEHGIVVPEGDVAALAGVLRDLAAPATRAALRDAGSVRVKEAYAPSRLADDVRALWGSIA